MRERKTDRQTDRLTDTEGLFLLWSHHGPKSNIIWIYNFLNEVAFHGRKKK